MRLTGWFVLLCKHKVCFLRFLLQGMYRRAFDSCVILGV